MGWLGFPARWVKGLYNRVRFYALILHPSFSPTHARDVSISLQLVPRRFVTVDLVLKTRPTFFQVLCFSFLLICPRHLRASRTPSPPNHLAHPSIHNVFLTHALPRLRVEATTLLRRHRGLPVVHGPNL
jgi:hypothetical protein